MKEPTRPAPNPARRRLRIVAGVAGVALLAATGAAWMFRVPLADRAARDALANMGLDADFEITDVGLGGAKLRALRIGPETAPDVAVAQGELLLGWGLTGPKLAGVRLTEPSLRVSLTEKGLSLGSLDKLKFGGGGGDGELPAMIVDITDGRALVSTPYGVLPATISSKGRLTRDFTGAVDIAPTSVSSTQGRLDGARLTLRARTEAGSLRVEGGAGLDRLAASDATVEAFTFDLNAVAPRKLSGATATARARATRIALGKESIGGLTLDVTAEPAPEDRFRIKGTLAAIGLDGEMASGQGIRVTLNAAGDAKEAAGEWTARTETLRATALDTKGAGGSGAFAWRNDDAGAVFSATGAATFPEAGLTAQGRRDVLDAIPTLGGSPLGPLFGSGRTALDRALTKFSTAAAMRLDWRRGTGRLSFPGPLTVQAASGGVITATPVENGRPVLMLLLPSADLEGGARLTMEGGGLPPATLSLARYVYGAKRLEAEGALRVADWRAAGGRLDLADTRFRLKSADGKGDFSLDGAVSLDGVSEAVRLRDLRMPLKLDASWGGGYRIMLRDGCTPIDEGEIGLPGHVIAGQRINLCPGPGGVLMGEDAAGRMLGGFSVDRPEFKGRTDDSARRPVSFAAQRIEGRFVGARGDSHLEISAVNPAYAIDYAADRRIRLAGDLFTARTESGGRVGGAFTGGVFEDPTMPANVTEIAARWSSTPERGRNVVRMTNGVATLTDKKPADTERAVQAAQVATPVTPETATTLTTAAAAAPAPEAEWKPRFNPVRVGNLNATLLGSEIDATGVVDLINGDRRLATLTVHHDLKTGEGVADIDNPGLVFDKKLDLYEITELARGVVDSVEGPVGLDLRATWNAEGITTGGHVILTDVNLNAIALGPVTGLSGNVAFNDLALLTTPPGQTLTIKRLNPGVVVENGVINFQMLSADRIKMESAAWPFAGGTLSVDPQIVQIGDKTFRMTLTLRGVDVARFLQQMELKDLTATGTVEGSFPLVFDEDGGAIEGKGTLHAAPGGGTITYTGSAGAGLVGAPQIAFEALRSFRYDDLVLELSGKLDGDLVTDIRFTGTNQEPVQVVTGPVASPIPGLGRITATGLPFRFTVSVRAPFRRLMQTSDSINDARTILEEAVRNGDTSGTQAPGPSSGQEPATNGTGPGTPIDPAPQPPK